MEIWKNIKGCEGLYQVSSNGKIKSLGRKAVSNHNNLRPVSEKILCQTTNKYGYKNCFLSKDGKTKVFLVHRLVADAFIPNPYNLPMVNHKNENKADNRVENLEWCNATYNVNTGTRNKRVATKLSKPVIQTDLDNNVIKEYRSIRYAARKTNINLSSIISVCQGRRKTAGGYKWSYK